MPRKRANPGAGYSNRTDQMTKTQPVVAAPNQAYGERGQQEALQKALPLPQQQSTPVPPRMSPQDAAAAHPFQAVGLGAPTARPNEPLTAGMASGPGPGPEAITLPFSTPAPNMSALIQSVAENSNSSDLRVLADMARQLGQ